MGKNYLILHNNNNYKKMKTHDKIDVMDWDRSIQTEISQQNTNQEFNEFVSTNVRILGQQYKCNI